jgi:very-short-patch-repair endonuclease
MIGRTNRHALTLRKNATDAEKLLWKRLRSRQIADAKFRRQATVGPYIADFLCTEHRLIVEADGGQHSPEADATRTDWLTSRGYRVLRFWNNDVLGNIDGVLEAILIALQEEREPSPQPSPAGAGEGAI